MVPTHPLLVGDLLQAGWARVVAAIVIRWTHWLPADPLASLLSTVLIMRGAWALVRESVDVLLEGAPAHIQLDAVRASLEKIPGRGEHPYDLHVWTVTSGVVAASAHAIVRASDDHQSVLERAHELMGEMGIHHVTVQLERHDSFERKALHLHP